ncbi:Protein of unknown function [Pyronema omphalodes CBS 100304]|uniref:Uncharacterized protein n=1 Tax=Pyronema omphalodes (strain CBS 100304) TaxID=1076935 RepID=U4LSC4_PYROM|nr:Protein of unknown function [Pyronema omphalodes CBS 100304]
MLCIGQTTYLYGLTLTFCDLKNSRG